MTALRRISLVALCCVFSIPAAADAKVQQSPMQIALDGGDAQTIRGHLTSSRYPQCQRARTVGLYAPGSSAPFHTIVASRSGTFTIALADIPALTTGFKVTAPQTRIGNWVCQKATVPVPADFVTLSGGSHDGVFSGVLFSDVEACEPGRLIELYEISSGEPVFNGSDLTDSSGAWVISQAGGTWQAQAVPRFNVAGGVITYCRAVSSQPWTFEEPTE
ncbi:MAG TPA: hypothetical protein VD790_03920 [Thermoleophilaceae bacterium]|nr:hypothetical protein [Thermoleophilaceae bacterium]